MATSKRLQVTDPELARAPLRFRETDLHLFRPNNFFGLMRCEDDAHWKRDRRSHFMKEERRAIDQMITECTEKEFVLETFVLKRDHM